VAVQPGRAVIIVTHGQRVFSFGDRIIYMIDGKVEKIEIGPGIGRATARRGIDTLGVAKRNG